jgi:hypothetical protein
MTLNNHDYDYLFRRVRRSAQNSTCTGIHCSRLSQWPNSLSNSCTGNQHCQWAVGKTSRNCKCSLGNWTQKGMVVHSIVYFVTMVWGRSPQLGEPQLGELPQSHYGGAVLRSSGHHNHPCRNSGPTDSVGPHKPSLSMENWLHNLIVN